MGVSVLNVDTVIKSGSAWHDGGPQWVYASAEMQLYYDSL